MPLAPNSRLGPYEIKSVLGVGGMGEVYRARDSRLNRDVAIKVLRSDSTATPELKSRFEREARAVAALNHPNIVSVFDFGIDRVDGAEAQYIVSELIEGESLRQLIAGKPVATRRLVDIAVQITDGLAAAHAAGIVHRDLKPENILVTKDGRAKILDFGLARQTTKTVPANSSDETYAPETKENLTSAGSILGTASYMSPEQAVGKETDYRSDQFSFGLILHEMATGKQAFARNSSVETMAAIVRDEPPPIEQKLPAPLKWIIDRCLHKEPEQRYESTRDLYQELRNLREHFSEAYSSSGVLPPVSAKPRAVRWKLLAVAAATSLFAVSLITYLLKPSGQFIGNYRYTPFASDAPRAIWSPDGKAAAYTSSVNGVAQVFLRYLDSSAALQLTHETGKYGATSLGWAADGSHVFVVILPDRKQLGVLRVSSVAVSGGDLETIVDTDCSLSQMDCATSPNGKALAEISQGPGQSRGPYGVWLSDPMGSPFRQYLPAPFASGQIFGGAQVTFSPDGRKLLLSRSGNLHRPEVWLLPYPAGGGPPMRILQNLSLSNGAQFSWMSDSRHVLISAALDPAGAQHLWIADTSSGDLEPLTNGPHQETNPAISPDGRSILYNEHRRQFDIASISVVDGSTSVVPVSAHEEHKPAWAAHQSKLTWVSERNGSSEIWMRSVDGSDRPVITARDFPPGTTFAFLNPALSPEGDRLIYGRIDTAGAIQLWVSSLNGGSPARVTTSSPPANEYPSAWSPDGRQFTYMESNATGDNLMIVKTSGNATPAILKKDVAWSFLPDWSPDGEWITYEDGDGAGLISPDGKKLKSLGPVSVQGSSSPCLAFSKDGKHLYGISRGPVHPIFFSLDLATLRVTTIKELDDAWLPQENLLPGIRFSVAPDGKSFVYAITRVQNDLWMLQGYRQPGLWNQLTSPFSSSRQSNPTPK